MGVVLHCLGEEDLQRIIRIFSDPTSQLSCHYLVPEESAGTLYKKYPELFQERPKSPDHVPVIAFRHYEHPHYDRAWHAGVSSFANWNALPGCATSLNGCTIGIEFQSTGYGRDRDVYAFGRYADPQMATGIGLIRALIQHHQLDPRFVLGHSDIAWDRVMTEKTQHLWDADLPKTDPGPHFPWGLLETAGIGYLPKPERTIPHFAAETEKILWTQCRLQDMGYENCPTTGQLCAMTQRAINGFRMHYAPEEWIGPQLGITKTLVKKLLGFQESLALSSSFIEHAHAPRLEQAS